MTPLALTAARTYHSKETGFIHYNYADPTTQGTIPLYENVCFALALLRTKERDKIHAARELLTRLLPFEVDGDFPLYLHEYPACTSPSHSVNLAVPLHWMVKRYASLLQEPLASTLEALLARLLARATAKPLSWNAQMKLAALQNHFDPTAYHPRSQRDWGDYLICCTLTNTDASRVLPLWNPSLALYTGAGLWQEQTEPAVSLLDLFLCSHYGLWSKRARSPHPTHLHAALVYPLNAPTTLPEPRLTQPTQDPFTLYWGDLDALHSLTLRTPATLNGLTLTLPQTTPGPDALELSLYLNRSPAHTLRVAGAKATTFTLDDPLTLTTGSQTLTLTFELLEGSGTFCGHIFHGNRPNQIALKGAHRFATFDWQIALRTIQRTPTTTLRLQITP